ncbi:hypothetical protein [Krasilnikovia sp. M28-CT-15]|uniref:hypothetical protein n=1 Tax=Krasilnikovia sp. M28-CT-15 TaxID=3373540 RepID=UPI00387683EA
MSNLGVQAPRRGPGLALLVLAIPVIMFVAIAAVLIVLKVAHSPARWTAVNKTCPVLDASTAAALGMVATPLPDDNVRGARDTSELRNCFYSPGDGSHHDLQVSVSLYQGSILRSSHAEAVAALDEYPPSGFRPLGQQDDNHRFGDRGPGSSRLVLINLVDNAEVRVQLYNRDKLGTATDAATENLRAPMQAVADQAIANLG